MDAKKRFTAVGFIIVLSLAFGVAPARADSARTPDVAAFYLRGTCLCNTVPAAGEALGLADGYLDDAGPITGVGYPAGLLFALDSAFGASGVNSHLNAVPDGVKVTLAGVSQGAIVLNYVKQSLALRITPQRPQAQLSFVTFGDPMNATGGIIAKNPALWLSIPPGRLPTPYATTEIVREYDGLSDWPDHPTPLSVLNAAMRVAYVHPFYGAAADPSTPGTLKTVSVNAVGGATTHYLVPTAGLPISQPLRDVGINTTLVDRWLRPQIDSAYKHRPEVVPNTTAAVAAAEPRTRHGQTETGQDAVAEPTSTTGGRARTPATRAAAADRPTHKGDSASATDAGSYDLKPNSEERKPPHTGTERTSGPSNQKSDSAAAHHDSGARHTDSEPGGNTTKTAHDKPA